jgi:hypothetical protein
LNRNEACQSIVDRAVGQALLPSLSGSACLTSGKAKFRHELAFKLFNAILHSFSANTFFKNESVTFHGVFPPGFHAEISENSRPFSFSTIKRHLGNVGKEIAQTDIEQFEGQFMEKLGIDAS